MLRVVVTGGLCSGKSTVSGLLRARGWAVIDADAIGHRLLEPGGEAAAAVMAAFGTLDRGQLAARVFGDEAARQRLNGLLHPPIRAEMQRQLAELERQGTRVAAAEIALYYEEGAQGAWDRVIAVGCDTETRLRRCGAQRQMTRAAAKARMAAQWTDEARARRADYAVDNSGTPEATAAQVERIASAIEAELGEGTCAGRSG